MFTAVVMGKEKQDDDGDDGVLSSMIIVHLSPEDCAALAKGGSAQTDLKPHGINGVVLVSGGDEKEAMDQLSKRFNVRLAKDANGIRHGMSTREQLTGETEPKG